MDYNNKSTKQVENTNLLKEELRKSVEVIWQQSAVFFVAIEEEQLEALDEHRDVVGTQLLRVPLRGVG